MNLDDGSSAESRRITSMPSISGMRMSVMTICGFKSAAACSPSSPPQAT
nr:hypothetical protein [Paenibacillus luteus]